jgi:hypothetical protein
MHRKAAGISAQDEISLLICMASIAFQELRAC